MSDWKNPDHYKKQGFEAIDVIRSVLTEEQYTGYLDRKLAKISVTG
jgi:hypothetical protein